MLEPKPSQRFSCPRDGLPAKRISHGRGGRRDRCRSRLVLLAGLLFLLPQAGCLVGPNYSPPESALAPGFADARIKPEKSASGRIVAVEDAPDRWWAVFEDPELNSLIDRAMKGNRDIRQAVSRLRQARAVRASLASGLFPEVDATGGYERGRGSKNVTIPLGALESSSGGGDASGSGSTGGSSSSARSSGSASGRRFANAEESSSGGGGTSGSSGSGSGSGSSSSGSALGGSSLPSGLSGSPATPPGGPSSPFGEGGLPGVTTNLYQVGFDATWEIDLFGASRRGIEAANAQVAAAEEDGRSVIVTLLAEVASSYMDLRADQARTAIARKNLQTQRETLAVIQANFAAGLATDLDVDRQTAQADAVLATIPTLQMQERQTLHALAFLLGEDPDALVDELAQPAALPELPPRIPIGVPSDLLRRRPDIRRSERQLAAATAEVGIATAQLFPQFSLTGALGLDSSDVKHLPEWGSRYYAISPGISWPILDWGRARANIRIQNEVQEQAFITYQNTVAQALKDVEDALVSYEMEQARRAALADALEAGRRALATAKEEFTQGVVDETTTLEAERTVLTAEDNLAQSDATIRTDLVALYKALGGGWRD